ncbi:cold-shock protein, partial [Mycolicibacterium fortuitum]
MQSRRSAPSILFTALAATVVIVPWAISGSDSSEQHHAESAAPLLTQQPLDNLAVGESIREIHQDTPFSMVALTSPDLRGTSARVRARKDDGSWGPWYQAENLDGVGADTPGPRGTEPVFVGRTTAVQIAVTRAPRAATPPPPGKPAKSGPALGYVPANVEAPIGQNVTAVLISPPQSPVDVG